MILCSNCARFYPTHHCGKAFQTRMMADVCAIFENTSSENAECAIRLVRNKKIKKIKKSQNLTREN